MGVLEALAKGFAAAVLLLMGAACAQRGTIIEERIERVSVPVAVGCIGGVRPAEVAPLKSRFTDAQWATLTPKQKAAEVAAQALRHQSHSQALAAVTSACR